MSDSEKVSPGWMFVFVVVMLIFCVLILIGIGTVISWLT